MLVVICDDDEGYCSSIENWLNAYAQEEKLDIAIEVYNRADYLLTHLREGRFCDLIFLDIELPGLTGIELGQEIRKYMQADEISIVFISGKTEYCMELFGLQPLNFHNKPLKREDILWDVEMVLKRLKKGKKMFSYHEDGVFKGIPLKDVAYMEAVQKSVIVTTRSGQKISVRDSINKLELRYQGDEFCRCRRSLLVNINFVDRYYKQILYLKDGKEVIVGRKYLENVKKAVNRVIFGVD